MVPTRKKRLRGGRNRGNFIGNPIKQGKGKGNRPSAPCMKRQGGKSGFHRGGEGDGISAIRLSRGKKKKKNIFSLPLAGRKKEKG